ncbi:hypothetical protein AB0M48_05560 [Lentzea sp. NPDC051208]|uniref:hypothetical protein n=1 Tax=Lentzea sp. NPDC051208 TaxID=3154642 RepID=UPI003445C272
MKLLTGVVVGALGFALLSAPAVSAAPVSTDVSATENVSAAVAVSRTEMIQRAKSWNPHTAKRIPYSQSKTHGGYRTDCSGYVAMAAKLAKPGPNTVGLASSTHTVAINKNDMRMGDLFIDSIGDANSRHVVIFEKWANAQRTAYWAYEQRGGYGTDYRTRSYGLGGDQYKARRLKNITG